MRLRPYVHSRDFDAIKGWVADERTNAMWSAKHAPFPMEKDAFSDFLTAMFDKHGDCPFVAVTDEGETVGFICTSINMESNEAMLAFVIVDPAQRGKGYGKEMIELAAKYCFEILKAEAVQLNVQASGRGTQLPMPFPTAMSCGAGAIWFSQRNKGQGSS